MEAVRNAFEENDSIEAITARFGVSTPAMHWRLYNLDIVETAPR
jgi:hypothetical protein